MIDDRDEIRTASGIALRREEVWVNDKGVITKYNLAYIDHLHWQTDNGRVLRYDNAHGFHERHWMGTSEETDYTGYDELVQRFDKEIRLLLRRKE